MPFTVRTIAGPPVVARLGEHVTKEELGGAEIHAKNGAVDDEVESEDEAFARTRRFLSYLPSSIDGLGERTPSNDDPNRRHDRGRHRGARRRAARSGPRDRPA